MRTVEQSHPLRCRSLAHEIDVPAVIVGVFDSRPVNDQATSTAAYCRRCASILEAAGVFVPQQALPSARRESTRTDVAWAASNDQVLLAELAPRTAALLDQERAG